MTEQPQHNPYTELTHLSPEEMTETRINWEIAQGRANGKPLSCWGDNLTMPGPCTNLADVAWMDADGWFPICFSCKEIMG